MSQTLFTNVRILDGSGKKTYPGEVLLQGNRIKAVAGPRSGAIAREGAKVIDGGGATLMPGLTDAHGHLSLMAAPNLTQPGDTPPEEHILGEMHNAKLVLDYGFTSVYSAFSAKPRLDIVIRNEINAGRIPGPRLRACSPILQVTGDFTDARQLHMHHDSVSIFVDGPIEIRRVAREMIREGVDQIKLTISGDEFGTPHARAEMLTMFEDEVQAACEVALSRGKDVCAHTRAAPAIKLALKHGVRVLYHCDFADEEALDMLEAKKDKIFVAPVPSSTWLTATESQDWGFTPEVVERMHLPRKIAISKRTIHEIWKRGIKVLPGGDWGFAWTPLGQNARDYEFFRDLYGIPVADSLKAATMYGAQLMHMGDELGQVKAGYLADLLLIDGDPLADVSILQDIDKILMVMKNGEFHRAPDERRLARRRKTAAAAE
ncbi:MAG: amidohydrolase family protein [Alphaproteobacteria bacterium]|nr:amidohydrolase family protein [Alphaproteobacteria bacterium]